MAKTETKRRGRPPLSAAEKKRREELRKQGKQPRQARRARDKNKDKNKDKDRGGHMHVELPQQGWWQTIHHFAQKAIICNPITQEFRLLDLERGTMTRVEEPTIETMPVGETRDRDFSQQPTVSVDSMAEAA